MRRAYKNGHSEIHFFFLIDREGLASKSEEKSYLNRKMASRGRSWIKIGDLDDVAGAAPCLSAGLRRLSAGLARSREDRLRHAVARASARRWCTSATPLARSLAMLRTPFPSKSSPSRPQHSRFVGLASFFSSCQLKAGKPAPSDLI